MQTLLWVVQETGCHVLTALHLTRKSIQYLRVCSHPHDRNKLSYYNLVFATDLRAVAVAKHIRFELVDRAPCLTPTTCSTLELCHAPVETRLLTPQLGVVSWECDFPLAIVTISVFAFRIYLRTSIAG